MAREAANFAIVMNYGDGDQAIIAGLNNIQLSGVSRNVIDVVPFRDEPEQLAGAKNRTQMTFSGYTTLDDPGQIILKQYLDANTAFGPVGHANGHTRCYYDLPESGETAALLTNDFRALDTANYPDGTYKVGSFAPQSADANGLFTFSSGFMVGGREADFYVHYTATTIGFTNSDPDTLTDSASGFVTAGFVAGMTIIVEGSTSNDGIYGPIASVAAGVITLPSGDVLAVEAAGESVTIHGGF